MTTTFVDNPRYPDTDPSKQFAYSLEPRNFSTRDIFYEKIQSGPNKNFYRRVPPELLKWKSNVYSRAFFPHSIEGPYGDYLEKMGDFYYIPRNDQIDIRRLMYGLINNKMPTDGNTETYNLSFNRIAVPRNFCPRVEPCIYDWCEPCRKGEFVERKQIVRRRITIMNLLYLMFFVWLVSNIVLYALLN